MGAVLVTGAAGYVGSFVLRACLHAGFDAVALDDLSQGHTEAVARAATGPVPGRLLSFVQAQVGSEAKVRAAVRDYRIEACIHLAGSSRVGESVERPLAYYRNNLTDGLALLDALLGEGVRRFVFSSSAAVYGEPGTVPITEMASLQPTSPYGDTKAAFETVLAACSRAHGLRSLSLRYFNAAGADAEAGLGEDHQPESHLIPRAVDAALRLGPEVTVFGDDYPTPDGTAVRDYVDVRDLALAHVLGLRTLARGDSPSALNLGTGQGHSVREVLGAVGAAVGASVPYTVGPRRAGDPATLVAAVGRAHEVLGWQPEHRDLVDTAAATVAWRRRHPTGYGRTKIHGIRPVPGGRTRP